MRNKKGGSVPESFYERSDAVVEVCGTLVDAAVTRPATTRPRATSGPT